MSKPELYKTVELTLFNPSGVTCPPPVFSWPHHDTALLDIHNKMRAQSGTVLAGDMVEKLKTLGIYRDNQDTQIQNNLKGWFLILLHKHKQF